MRRGADTICSRDFAEALRGGPRYDVEYRVLRLNDEVRIVPPARARPSRNLRLSRSSPPKARSWMNHLSSLAYR
jgi:hypothetical protein